ncbi:aspartate--tRNA ligase [Liberiplasma polymorphum]|uniref:aspartate--tRNA ligase n=1 Tax=Liberiplasma polymorphum TaxID=3374570 RepID=UPI0037742402
MATHHNNELTMKDIGKTVTLKGFVSKRRDLGNLVFIDLRDMEGITQLAFDSENDLKSIAAALKNEYVLEVSGVVQERSSKNPQLKTGDIEVNVTKITVLNTAKQPPMMIQDDTDALEETRLKYRYLDLRRPILQNMMKLRHQMMQAVRGFLNNENFMEFETPILTKSTPEGARDYVVPSRIHKGEFYALPQSPQIFKQLLMISGFEKYYQIAKCFRDEDLRSDRQPEFTQIDIEMSFVNQEDVIDLSERMIKHVMKHVKGIELLEPFKRITFHEAMSDYGSDKPDTRFDMKLKDLNTILEHTEFNVFKTIIADGGSIQAINVKDGAKDFSRKDIDKLTEEAKKYGAKGLSFIKFQEETTGSIVKFLSEEELLKIKQKTMATEGDLLLIVASSLSITRSALGHLRKVVAKRLNLIDPDTYDFTWVVDWPMFEYDEETARYYALHHPFTRVQDCYKSSLADDPDNALAYCYDLVVQGQELGGGSMRIHEEMMQKTVFDLLSITEKEQVAKFGFLTEALQYGTPPHGGIAFGFDRFVMLLGKTENIRDVIAFPKTSSAQCLLTDAPSVISEEQYKELALKK